MCISECIDVELKFSDAVNIKIALLKNQKIAFIFYFGKILDFRQYTKSLESRFQKMPLFLRLTKRLSP